MERLLKRYAPVSLGDIEQCHKGCIDAFLCGKLSEEYMERLVRFTATNNQIQRHGLAALPLSLTGEASLRDEAECTEESLPEECKEIGLTKREYSALKGDYGTVIGVSVKKNVYQGLMRKCKSKRAFALRHNEVKTKAFTVKKMKEMAASLIKRKQKGDILASIRTLARPNILIKG